MSAIVVDQDAFDTLVEKAAMWAVLVEDGSKVRVAGLVADYAQFLGPSARRVIAAHIIEHDSNEVWQPALRALSRKGLNGRVEVAADGA